MTVMMHWKMQLPDFVWRFDLSCIPTWKRPWTWWTILRISSRSYLVFFLKKTQKRASLIPPWWLWSHWVVSPGSWWQVVPNGEEKWWTLGQGGLGSCRPTVTWRKRPFFRNVLNDQVVVSQFQTCLFLGNCHIFLKLCSISEVDIHTLVKANQLVFHPFPLFFWGMFPFRYISFRYVGDHQLVNLV